MLLDQVVFRLKKKLRGTSRRYAFGPLGCGPFVPSRRSGGFGRPGLVLCQTVALRLLRGLDICGMRGLGLRFVFEEASSFQVDMVCAWEHGHHGPRRTRALAHGGRALRQGAVPVAFPGGHRPGGGRGLPRCRRSSSFAPSGVV